MAEQKEKGLVGAAQNMLRQTTGALRGEGPWHSLNSEVYHNNPNCRVGNRMYPNNVQRGTGNKPLCRECERLNSLGAPVNVTGI
jgi:hypothetical protein